MGAWVPLRHIYFCFVLEWQATLATQSFEAAVNSHACLSSSTQSLVGSSQQKPAVAAVSACGTSRSSRMPLAPRQAVVAVAQTPYERSRFEFQHPAKDLSGLLGKHNSGPNRCQLLALAPVSASSILPYYSACARLTFPTSSLSSATIMPPSLATGPTGTIVRLHTVFVDVSTAQWPTRHSKGLKAPPLPSQVRGPES
ncbi:hypothetical protein C8Q78DRAFT_1011707 [Trametes maxima]|nr:hypothetical protein C8Q78DRAFT_1011707 [Trametes maxima]